MAENENNSWEHTHYTLANRTFITEDNLNYTYIYILVPIISFCVLSIACNVVILSSVYWIRRPISPTLHISLSLAVSDLYTLILDGLSLTLNSLLPIGLGVDFTVIGPCGLLLLEILRMGGRLTTLGHLLALAGNHYLGIREPLKYPIFMTCRNISIVTFILWTVPSAAFVTYCHLLEDDGFSAPDCSANFMMKREFRLRISLVFFGAIVIMSAIYLHIYLLVRRHQENRNRIRRVGSAYVRNNQNCGDKRQESREEKKNEKALFTTLLIVGSTVLGWLPASLSFFLVCDDCMFQVYSSIFWMIFVNALSNTLLILKTALNSYIYAARMAEIRAAMKKMKLSMKRTCCKVGSTDMNGFSDSRNLHSRASTHRSQRTIHCRIQSLQRHSNTTQL